MPIISLLFLITGLETLEYSKLYQIENYRKFCLFLLGRKWDIKNERIQITYKLTPLKQYYVDEQEELRWIMVCLEDLISIMMVT